MHDMRYYGGEVISLISKTLECTPVIDRGNVRIWCDSIGERAIFLSLSDNDYCGSLEVHENGRYMDQINNNGVLVFNSEIYDLVVDCDVIVKFLNKWKR